MNLKELIKLLPTGCSNFSMGSETDSFYVCSEGHDFYVEPEFETVFAEDSQPSVIFISAVGASGKTALAEKLSFETGAPIFNLAKNRNVGDGTLKKTLMECYEEEVFNVQRALKSGKQCIIIDALDEGRSKVNEKSFETFLDDIIGLCDAGDSGVSFILLGRTKVLEDSCLYLESRDISTNVFGIKAFSMEKIKEYIDKSCKKNNSTVDSNYIDCRDELISKMTTSFKQGLDDESNVFLNFLGYPPVLDSIATTLLRENNYFAFYKELKSAEGYGSEKNMLVGISRHILKREQFDKVKNNIVDSIGYEDGKRCSYDFDGVYSEQEQCLRLLYYVLGKDFNIQIIPDEELNAKYEEQLKEFFVEHPFLAGKSFRNPVFEAFVLARLMAAPHPYTELFDDFFESHKSTYHLLHMYKALNDGTTTDTKAYLPFLIRSSQELRSARIIPTLSIKGDS